MTMAGQIVLFRDTMTTRFLSSFYVWFCGTGRGFGQGCMGYLLPLPSTSEWYLVHHECAVAVAAQVYAAAPAVVSLLGLDSHKELNKRRVQRMQGFCSFSAFLLITLPVIYLTC
jgi:hypothetical protein